MSTYSKNKGTKVPVSKRQVPKGKPMKKKQSPSTTKGTMLSNPYQNVPVQSNNQVPKSGFGFPGSVY